MFGMLQSLKPSHRMDFPTPVV